MVKETETPHRSLPKKATPSKLEVTLDNQHLKQLYESTEEDMRFAIGTIIMPGNLPCPIINIYYANWSREKLEVVRESFKGGVILVSAERKPGMHDVYLGTRETIAIQEQEGEHTSILRAPAWDAHMKNVEERVFRLFDSNRKRRVGFLLMLQTPEWEFLTAVDDGRDSTIVGVLLQTSMPAEME